MTSQIQKFKQLHAWWMSLQPNLIALAAHLLAAKLPPGLVAHGNFNDFDDVLVAKETGDATIGAFASNNIDDMVHSKHLGIQVWARNFPNDLNMFLAPNLKLFVSTNLFVM